VNKLFRQLATSIRLANVPWWQEFAINLIPGGINLRPVKNVDDDSYEILWKNVLRIDAYKHDLYSTDLVCLLFVISDDEYEVNEEMIGWKELIENLQHEDLKVIDYDTWWPKVVQPPFAENRMNVYKRN
jgi:hypothetical protein